MGYLAGLLVCAIVSADPPVARERLEVPPANAMADARTLVKDAFKARLSSKKDEEKKALARDLIASSREGSQTPAVRYVLLLEANRIAVDCGDVGMAADSLKDLAAGFRTPLAKLVGDTLDGLKGKAKEEFDRIALAAEAANLALLVAPEDIDAAVKAMSSASRAAGTTRSKELKAAIAKLAEGASALKRRCDAGRKALPSLEKEPDDPRTNLSAGRYLCLVLGEWDKGIPLLFRGSDAELRLAAAADISAKGAADVRFKAGNVLWNLSEKETWVEAYNLRLRAAHWYSMALDGLIPLERKVALERIEAGARAPFLDPTDFFGKGGWMVLFRSKNPAIWNKKVGGKDEMAVPLSECPKEIRHLRLTRMDTKEYILIPMTWERLGKVDGKVAKEPSHLWVGDASSRYNGLHLGVSKYPPNLERGLIIILFRNDAEQFSGWGFGHVAQVDKMQGYSWDGKPIPETAFEIAVTARELTAEERKFFLK